MLTYKIHTIASAPEKSKRANPTETLFRKATESKAKN
jgi:hypothetical protein